MMWLEPVEWGDIHRITEWRKANPEGARTPFALNLEQQDKWFKQVICDRKSEHRYWSVWDDKKHVGLSGITNIEHENRRGEIALLIDPEKRGRGLGKKALMLTLAQGFGNMDLEQVYGECYLCNQYIEFWRNLGERYLWESVLLPSVKRWAGKRWDAWWFAIDKNAWARMLG